MPALPAEGRARLNAAVKCRATHFADTALVAEPPRLLRTVMFCGLAAAVNCPLNLPPPLFVRVPSSCPLEVTKARSVASAREPLASTRSVRFDESYSALCTETVSALACGGLTVNVAVRVTPPETALTVTAEGEVTGLVLTPKVADVEPAATVTLAGTLASVLPVERFTTVAACAGALKVTVPCALAPPVTADGFSVSDDRAGAVVAGGVMLSTALCVEPP